MERKSNVLYRNKVFSNGQETHMPSLGVQRANLEMNVKQNGNDPKDTITPSHTHKKVRPDEDTSYGTQSSGVSQASGGREEQGTNAPRATGSVDAGVQKYNTDDVQSNGQMELGGNKRSVPTKEQELSVKPFLKQNEPVHGVPKMMIKVPQENPYYNIGAVGVESNGAVADDLIKTEIYETYHDDIGTKCF